MHREYIVGKIYYKWQSPSGNFDLVPVCTGFRLECGDRAISESIQKLIILIPMVVDPHGQLSPFVMCFLYGTSRKPLTFRANYSNSEEMYGRITTDPCPSGIILQAAGNWKRGKTTHICGGSYTTPTPHEYTMQQLRLMLAKAYVLQFTEGYNEYRC